MLETSVVMHFFNEEILIGPWIDYHKRYFDHGVLINHQSTDSSYEIAKSKIPDNWKIIDTKLDCFDAALNDLEVMEIEETLPPSWKMVLNVTEFLFCYDFKSYLQRMIDAYPDKQAFGSRPFTIIDKEDNLPIEFPYFRNRTYGFLNFGEGNPVTRLWRFIHNQPNGKYVLARHNTHLPAVAIPEFLHLHLLYSPWPQCFNRKLQIQTRIPPRDKACGFGIQHIVDEQGLIRRREESLKLCKELRTDPLFKVNYDHLLLEN